MNNYQEKYIEILTDIKKLERRQEELISLLKSKDEVKKALEEKGNNLTQELENLKEEKDKILNVNYDDYISGLGKLYLCTIIMVFILHYKTYGIATPGLDKAIYYIVLCTGTALLCGLELNIIAKYISKRNTKILKSDEYKILLERIKTNEIEVEKISQKQKTVEDEYLNSTLEYSAVSASLKIKKELLENLKNEVFGIVVGNLTEPEDKPLTRIKTRENLNS